MANDFKEFQDLRIKNIKALSLAEEESNKGIELCRQLFAHQYTYNFDWLGVPIIQTPQDILAIQEIMWKTKPTVIIETGVARGGSLIFYASILKLLNEGGRVIGIDIDIRDHNRDVIESHPLSDAVILMQGSSTDDRIIEAVKSKISPSDRVMVVLDSNHTHDHVLKELELYSPLVTRGCYLVVLDTVVEDIPEGLSENRPWGKGNNPKTAVHHFLKSTDQFLIDDQVHKKLVITCAPDGYLKRI
tara:strand:- start:1148 stop:1882 length:735 start_codon:yes stop_codon:yes gene_type:complete